MALNTIVYIKFLHIYQIYVRKGTFSYCLWSCPLISELQRAVSRYIKIITRYQLPVGPEFFLHNSWHEMHVPSSTKDLISLLFNSVKHLLVLHWKILAMQEWLPKLWDLQLYYNEKISCVCQHPIKIVILFLYYNTIRQ